MTNSICADVRIPGTVQAGLLQERLTLIVDDLIATLPSVERVCATERRGVIARYCAVLEGNFIYWMTAALLSVATEEARSIILDNLHEEIRDCHPDMLRKFAVASRSVPGDLDAAAVCPELANVRLFLGNLSPLPIIAMMAFFEDFIRRFMPFLAELARLQGSDEFEYTAVHSVCDVVHAKELFRAFAAEADAGPQHDESDEVVLEGVRLLYALLWKILGDSATQGAACEGNGAAVPLEHWTRTAAKEVRETKRLSPQGV